MLDRLSRTRAVQLRMGKDGVHLNDLVEQDDGKSDHEPQSCKSQTFLDCFVATDKSL